MLWLSHSINPYICLVAVCNIERRKILFVFQLTSFLLRYSCPMPVYVCAMLCRVLLHLYWHWLAVPHVHSHTLTHTTLHWANAKNTWAFVWERGIHRRIRSRMHCVCVLMQNIQFLFLIPKPYLKAFICDFSFGSRSFYSYIREILLLFRVSVCAWLVFFFRFKLFVGFFLFSINISFSLNLKFKLCVQYCVTWSICE